MNYSGFPPSVRQIYLIVILLLTSFSFQSLSAQTPGGGRPGGGNFNPAQMNIGRFYGKIVDNETGKGIAYASIQLVGMQWDTVTKRMEKKVVGGQLTEENGEFSLENLPIMGDFTLKVNYLGYATIEQTVTFGIKPGQGRPGGGGGGGGGGQRPNMGAGAVEKDLGNIRLSVNSTVLKEVEISAEATRATLALDKKVYRVDKDNVAAGGTAEDALKNIPSLNVDIDGNLTLRNAAPQLFIDGRPTPLSLDQIPADAIENVEVITNPSARFDAGGGQSGIVNIVLKKERKIGYNGSVRTGIDMRGRVNIGGDINAREGKMNVFLGGNYNQRRNLSTGQTDRFNLINGVTDNRVLQNTDSENNGFFGSGRAGLDWFINNRNTLTLSGNLHGGTWNNEDDIAILTDYYSNGVIGSTQNSRRFSETERAFRNFGSQVLFKHLFPKEGQEWTADLNINGANFDNTGTYRTDYLSTAGTPQSRQQSSGDGTNRFYTLQTDYVEPLKNGIKMEAGLRAAIRDYDSNNANFNTDTAGNLVQVTNIADRYNFHDEVYAAYGTFSKSFAKWGFQTGLRAESSRYVGTLPQTGQQFKNQYPISLFPSAFLTYKVNEEDNLQLNYSRRVNRPSFFNLIPYPDFSDSLNLSVGNPDLVPEFTNSLELSYQNIFSKRHNLLTSLWFKHSENLITRYYYQQFDPIRERTIVVSTYENTDNSMAYGLELTLKNTLWNIFDLTTNANFFNSVLNAQNIENSLSTEQFTWFVKENLSLKLPKQFTLQLNGSYQSRTAFDTGGGGYGRGGGGMGWGGSNSTAQGYTIPVWFVDASVRKDLWNRKGSITLSIQDIFRSRKTGSYNASSIFTQESWRRRDAQLVRLNFSYRFGKFDASLFRRKNTRSEEGGMDF